MDLKASIDISKKRNDNDDSIISNKENISSNSNYPITNIERRMNTLRNEFSEKKNYTMQKVEYDEPVTTRASTTALPTKPPAVRRYYRDNSVGSRIRYNYSKETLVKKPKFYGTKHNFSEYMRSKDHQNSARGVDNSNTLNNFKPPRIEEKPRRNSYAGRKFISDQ